ncbi:hypothetical protein MCOR03_002963 [Pyricularia oryzae]|nr:hypothetical protein MCOR34_004972 [Pyricularia oryzae]KAI6360977.1 hypothetical protein MCOR31_008899 [Pyricularia oryzae]KAI6386892.1 hypothetical protein MCOR32_000675 [Pyricularia oryzae]KAI6451683.1 hypothetical protein MCOR15_009181 [Pyricularia oryzae]KAI6563411.1 hypothetical protein MCOR03_002963 [Pyricularia oryzae]
MASTLRRHPLPYCDTSFPGRFDLKFSTNDLSHQSSRSDHLVHPYHEQTNTSYSRWPSSYVWTKAEERLLTICVVPSAGSLNPTEEKRAAGTHLDDFFVTTTIPLPLPHARHPTTVVALFIPSIRGTPVAGMPYTPPTHRSPASSQPSSPDASRRSSIAGGGPRPTLPRSASYLSRHRRTPSAPTGQNGQPTPESTSEDLKAMLAGSVRKSPPPVTDGLGMPNGAILSPPESTASSDDDETPEVRGRTLENLKELQAAISQIPQHRESSPSKCKPANVTVIIPPTHQPQSNQGFHHSFSTGSLEKLGKRNSHSRSKTESSVQLPPDNSTTASEVDSEEELLLKKPQMVRKKSGELVRPALRPSSRRRPSSMPGTPTFSKAVHFDSHLEHVRHFLQVDRPLAVSAGSSPADTYNSDSEFPFNAGEDRSGTRSPPYEWEIIVTNFPVETAARKALPLRLERVWLSADQKSLVGSVAVANLAFQKHVTCRFTFDYWKTTSEVAGEFSTEIRPKESDVGHDRFNFSIKLSELANLESKTLYFCVRYNVNGQEYWDSNGGANFQVDFRKKMLPQMGKRGYQGASSRSIGELPRSNRRSNSSLAPRPKSLQISNEFGENGTFDKSLQDYLGDDAGPLRLKGVKSTTSLPSDNLTGRLSAPSGQAFANRYDFGASLTTAIQAAKQTSPRPKGDGLYMKSNTRGSIKPAPRPTFVSAPTGANTIGASQPSTPGPMAKKEPAQATNEQKPSAFPASQTAAPILASSSYEELVNKYCFFGSKQSSPQLSDGTLKGGRLDGAGDDYSLRSAQSSNESSLVSSPLQMASFNRSHAIHAPQNAVRRDLNPYFPSTTTFALAPSPAMSPLQHSVERSPSPSQNHARPSVQTKLSSRSTSPASMAGGYPQSMTAIRG